MKNYDDDAEENKNEDNNTDDDDGEMTNINLDPKTLAKIRLRTT